MIFQRYTPDVLIINRQVVTHDPKVSNLWSVSDDGCFLDRSVLTVRSRDEYGVWLGRVEYRMCI